MNETRKIILWTVPRSVSTAFERSIMEIKDSKTFHEPYSMAYHLGPQKQSTVYTFEEIDPCNTYENIQAMLTKHYDGIKVIFAKDMAKAISNHLELLLDEAMKDYQHTFLIRDPRKALPSLYKTYVNPNAAGSNDFDPIEAGFVQFNQLYRFVKKYLDQNPVLIDADDLQQDPEGAMKAYCNATGIIFDKNMLNWDPGPISEWDVFYGWHDEVLNSSGFIKKQPIQIEKMIDLSMFPQVLQDCINEAIPIYESLKDDKLSV